MLAQRILVLNSGRPRRLSGSDIRRGRLLTGSGESPRASGSAGPSASNWASSCPQWRRPSTRPHFSVPGNTWKCGTADPSASWPRARCRVLAAVTCSRRRTVGPCPRRNYPRDCSGTYALTIAQARVGSRWHLAHRSGTVAQPSRSARRPSSLSIGIRISTRRRSPTFAAWSALLACEARSYWRERGRRWPAAARTADLGRQQCTSGSGGYTSSRRGTMEFASWSTGSGHAGCRNRPRPGYVAQGCGAVDRSAQVV